MDWNYLLLELLLEMDDEDGTGSEEGRGRQGEFGGAGHDGVLVRCPGEQAVRGKVRWRRRVRSCRCNMRGDGLARGDRVLRGLATGRIHGDGSCLEVL